MKTLQVIGPGCPRCRQLAERADQAARSLGIQYRIEEIRDPAKMAELGVAITPALAVDGTVVVVGKVPPLEDLQSLISAESAT